MQELCDKYILDKSRTYGHNYADVYENLFFDKKNKIKKLVEIGIGCTERQQMIHVIPRGYKTGNSLRMWRDYFPQADIFGIDIYEEAMITDEERIKTYIGDQSNKNQMEDIMHQIGGCIDIIIDDGSHEPDHQSKTFEYLEKYLSEDGIYCIEDIFNIEPFKDLSVFSQHARDIIQKNYDVTCYDQRVHPPHGNDFVFCLKRRKQSPQGSVILKGTGGLGNCLYQLGLAIRYAELYNYTITIDIDSPCCHIGTSCLEDRDRQYQKDGVRMSYKDTLFKNIMFDHVHHKSIDHVISIDYDRSHYDEEKISAAKFQNLMIRGLCQNYTLFEGIEQKFLEYLSFMDVDEVQAILDTKYNISKNKSKIMLGLRKCKDFELMTKVNAISYLRGIDAITGGDYEKYALLILADT